MPCRTSTRSENGLCKCVCLCVCVLMDIIHGLILWELRMQNILYLRSVHTFLFGLCRHVFLVCMRILLFHSECWRVWVYVCVGVCFSELVWCTVLCVFDSCSFLLLLVFWLEKSFSCSIKYLVWLTTLPYKWTYSMGLVLNFFLFWFGERVCWWIF